jgi:hypothetical protein
LSQRQPPSFCTDNEDKPANDWQIIAADWCSKATKGFFVRHKVMQLVRRKYPVYNPETFKDDFCDAGYYKSYLVCNYGGIVPPLVHRGGHKTDSGYQSEPRTATPKVNVENEQEDHGNHVVETAVVALVSLQEDDNANSQGDDVGMEVDDDATNEIGDETLAVGRVVAGDELIDDDPPSPGKEKELLANSTLTTANNKFKLMR